MGNSLHNKIHLGRTPLLASRPLQVALALTLTVAVVLAWVAVHSSK
jgi:hypothetical protein